jgi:hypothetical protein
MYWVVSVGTALVTGVSELELALALVLMLVLVLVAEEALVT